MALRIIYDSAIIFLYFYITSADVTWHISSNIMEIVYGQKWFKINSQIQKILWPTSTCSLKVNNGKIRTMSYICTKLLRKTPEWCHWRRSGIFIVNFEQILHIFWCFHILLWTREYQLSGFLVKHWKLFYLLQHISSRKLLLASAKLFQRKLLWMLFS